MRSEVAINREKLFLPVTVYKAYVDQVKLIESFSEKIGRRIPGVKAIMGQAADYADLAFAHLDKTKDRLFGDRDYYNYTRTHTMVGSDAVSVGSFRNGGKLTIVRRIDRVALNNKVKVAPLIVPV